MRYRSLLAALLLCLLCACGQTGDHSGGEESGGEIAAAPQPAQISGRHPAAAAGHYVCTALYAEDEPLNLLDKWLELYADGNILLSLYGSPDQAQWSLDGEELSILMEGSVIGSGTLRKDSLELKIMDLTGTFQKQAVSVPSSPAQGSEEPILGDSGGNESSGGESSGGSSFAASPTGEGVFACYGDLYYVDYPTSRYSPDPARMTDLRASDGAQLWITRLDSAERVTTWLENYQNEAYGAWYDSCEKAEWTIAGYPARLILYEEEGSWHNEVLVDFGQDLGTSGRAMYAAYFIFSGNSREAVWGADAQGIVNSLRLEEQA